MNELPPLSGSLAPAPISNEIPETQFHVDTLGDALTAIRERLVDNARKKAKAMRLEREAKDLREEFKYEEGEIWDSLFEAGMTSLKIDDDQYSLQEQVYGQVISISDFMEWADAEGRLDEFFEMKPRMKIINEFARELVDTGEDFPKGLAFRENRYISSPRKQTEEF